jgi:pyrimidine operon attenuation protein / uracil phosphoribosyltransferase
MLRRLILSSPLLALTITRLARQLMENHGDFGQTVLIGLQPRGKFLAQRISQELATTLGQPVRLGLLDATFYRDDFRRRTSPLQPSASHIPFTIEGQRVILIDDVLYTGRSVRAALDAMIDYGRPQQVELLVLVDRAYTRELPIAATYVGQLVNTHHTERVLVEWTEQGHPEDCIALVDAISEPAAAELSPRSRPA